MKTERERREALERFLKKVEIVPDAKMKQLLESGEALAVCVAVSMGGSDSFPDNEFGKCGLCDCAIYFRPYTRPAVNKVCVECCLSLRKAGQA